MPAWRQLTLCVFITGVASSTGWNGRLAETGEKRAAPLEAELTEIREVRTAIVERRPDAMIPAESPGLTLTYQLDPPDGAKVADVAQPEKIVASDSTGRDLSRLDGDGFGGEAQHVSVRRAFGPAADARPELLLKLGVTARAAETFSVETTVEATVYTGQKVVEAEAGEGWRQLDAADFGGEPVRVHFGPVDGFFGESWGVEIRPASVRTLIEAVAVAVEGDVVESDTTMWNDQSITYMLDGDFEEDEPATLRLTVRTGVERMPVVIRLKDRKLP